MAVVAVNHRVKTNPARVTDSHNYSQAYFGFKSNTEITDLGPEYEELLLT